MNVDTAIKAVERYDSKGEVKAIMESPTLPAAMKAIQVQSATVQLADGTQVPVCNVTDPKFREAINVLLGVLTLQVYSTAENREIVYNVPPHVIPAVEAASTGHYHISPEEYNTHWVHKILHRDLQALINNYDNHYIIYGDHYLYATFVRVD